MLEKLCLGAFQDKLCTDILLSDAGQDMPIGIHLFVIRQIHDPLFHRQRRTELFQRAFFLLAVASDTNFLLWILRIL